MQQRDRTTVATVAALVFAVALLYGQTLRHQFVLLDDGHYIYENPGVLGGLSRQGIEWAFTTYRGAHWHPLTWLSHQLDTTLFGTQPAGSYFTNVALHAASSGLLFLAFRSMTGAWWPSALVAMLFALHPLRVESVAWASERKDVLSGVFWMLTLLSYAWYVRRPGAPRYALVVLCFVLGLLAKPMLVTLPFVLLLLDIWPLRRWSYGNSPGSSFVKGGALALVREKIPLLVLAALASMITVRAQRFGLALQDTDKLSMPWRIVNALNSYVAYVCKTVWPSDLAVIYPHPGLIRDLSRTDVTWAIVAAFLLLAATLAAVWVFRRRPYVTIGWLWYLGTLVPVIGIVQVGDQAMADRYAYLPTIGLYIVVAWSLDAFLSTRPQARGVAVAVEAVAILLLAVATWFQIGTWRDSLTLFSHATRVVQDNYFAYANLGNVYRTQNDLAAAASAFERAVQIKPDFPFAQTNYGVVLEQQGRLDEAASHHLRALEIDANYARGFANLGAVRLKQQRTEEAIANFNRALGLDPELAAARGNLATALLASGNPAGAVPQLELALQRDPRNAEMHNNLGVALVRLGRLGEALPHFETALAINPSYANARKGLDYVRSRLGRAGSHEQ